jgi:hypothetical protein
MVYDPQRDQRRPRPADRGPAPVEAILDADRATQEPPRSAPVLDDPPPDLSVTPQPADPWPDRVFFGMSISTIIGAVVALVVFRWLWTRRRGSSSPGE